LSFIYYHSGDPLDVIVRIVLQRYCWAVWNHVAVVVAQHLIALSLEIAISVESELFFWNFSAF
jgi:hypothetical protein